MALMIVFIGTLGVSTNVHKVEASGTIYIKADGSIEGTTDISTVDNVTYTFTDNIYESIVVERNNITIDGADYALQGTGSGIGISISSRQYVTVRNVLIKSFDIGIYLGISLNNTISENSITNNNYGIYLSLLSVYNNISGNNIVGNGREYGIYLSSSSGNSISGNNIDTYQYGIYLVASDNNAIYGNTMTNNHDGITIYSSSNNKFYHNNFNNYINQGFMEPGYANFWDDGYPSGGNYWSNYTGVDLDPDGIGDTEHVIDANNTDNYPLMGMFSDFKATSEHHVQTVSNSTISDFQFNGTAICFNITGENGTTGFCRICIPTALMNDTFRVFVNGTEILPSPEPLSCSNSTHSYLYFTYNHSTQEVIIIPEFPTWTLMLLILTILTIAIAFYKRRLLKTPIP
jgi:parallel beta-helix repeat protein